MIERQYYAIPSQESAAPRMFIHVGTANHDKYTATVPLRESCQGRVMPISHIPHAKLSRRSPTCHSCPGLQRITDTRPTLSQLSLIRYSNHQTLHTLITPFKNVPANPETSHQGRSLS